MGDILKNDEIQDRRDPKHEIKDQRAKKLREHHLPVTDRRGHQRFDRAELKFFGKQSHGDERKNQHEGEPKEDRIEERLLYRVRNRALIHKRDLKIEIDAAHDQEKQQDDISDG